MLAGVKVSQSGDVFVSVPRWKNENGGILFLKKGKLKSSRSSSNYFKTGDYRWKHSPSTLSFMGNESSTINNSSHSQIGDPDAIQSVLGFEIDEKNILWVLDQGKVGGEAAIPGFKCATLVLTQRFYQIASVRLKYGYSPPKVCV